MADSLGTLNPLRYRSYVYDHETGLYYLQSRYYDPELGRFINADVYTSTGQGLLGNNMFAYCLNNPVRYIDPSGRIAIVDDVVALGIVVIIAVLAVVIITSPPVQQLVYGFCEAVVSVFTDVAQNVASITETKKKSKSLPKTGEPNSDAEIVDEKGETKQRRHYDENGDADFDIDYNHSNGDNSHEFPHVHIWRNGIRGKTPVAYDQFFNHMLPY